MIYFSFQKISQSINQLSQIFLFASSFASSFAQIETIVCKLFFFFYPDESQFNMDKQVKALYWAMAHILLNTLRHFT